LKCVHEGCTINSATRGYCEKHYLQFYKSDNFEPVRHIFTDDEDCAIIDTVCMLTGDGIPINETFRTISKEMNISFSSIRSRWYIKLLPELNRIRE
jgi:hypothetical protein